MSSKKKILFIVNPFAGHGSKSKIPGLIVDTIDKSKFDFDMVYTEHGGHAKILAKEGRANHMDAVVSVGGDGTINEIASELLLSLIHI